MIEGLLAWFGLSVLVGVIAVRRGRFGFGWFLLAMMISPLLAGLLVLVLADQSDDDPQATAFGAAEGRISPETHVRCPDCRELVRRDARKCKHCGTALIPQ